MNSQTSLINFKYLKESIKKSKGAIILLCTLIPLFSSLALYILTRNNYSVSIPSLLEISAPALIGLYILPITISIILFSFVYKKNSVDLIMSMPIKRTTIFCTNTLIGIMLFVIIFSLTALLTCIGNVLTRDMVIAPQMIFKYFATWTISYIFVYTVSNLCMTLTGNIILQIILTLFILFFPGYMKDYFNAKIDTSAYRFYMEEQEDEFKIKNSIDKDISSVVPYKYARIVPVAIFNQSDRFDSDDLIGVANTNQTIKMVVYSTIYFALGLYLFNKRKMEVAENTFLSSKTHNIVRCMLIFPIILGLLVIEKIGSFGITIVCSAIVITAYYLYDLVTKKTLSGFWKSSLYLFALIWICVIVNVLSNSIGEKIGNTIINKQDVKSVGILLENAVDEKILNVEITDYDLLSLIYEVKDNKNYITNETSSYVYDKIPRNNLKKIQVKLNLENNKLHTFNMGLNSEQYDRLLELLEKNSNYVSEYKKLDYDALFAIKLDEKLCIEYKDKIIGLIKQGLSEKSIKELDEKAYITGGSKGYSYKNSSNLAIAEYREGRAIVYYIDTELNKELLSMIFKIQNDRYVNEVKNAKISKEKVHVNYIDYMYDYDTSNKYIYQANSKIIEHINKNIENTDVNLDRKDLVSIVINTEYGEGVYVVNIQKTQEFQNILDSVEEYKTVYKEIEIDE